MRQISLDQFIRGANTYMESINVRELLLRDLIIGPSLCMSGLCYSIFKLDLYQWCEHRCLYCYSRMLPLKEKRMALQMGREFLNNLRALERALGDYPIFRMSTLTDAFHPSERIYKFSLKSLATCLREEIPLIISTKSTLITKEPWLSVIRKLSDEKLAIVQYTIITPNEKQSKILEPYAPSPEERLGACKKLRDLGVPVVVRLQPLIPGVNTDVRLLNTLLDDLEDVGVLQVIAEFFRFSQWRLLSDISKAAINGKLLTSRSTWTKYPLSPYKRPVLGIRLKVLENLKKLCDEHGLLFSTCREGFFHLHTASSCCGTHVLKRGLVKPTLYEVWKLKNEGKAIMSEDFYKQLRHEYQAGNVKFITPDMLNNVPSKEFKIKLLQHFKLLKNLVHDNSLLIEICPSFALSSH